jgi:hypothetical protein
MSKSKHSGLSATIEITAAPELLDALENMLVWALLCTASDNPHSVLNACADLRGAIAAIENAGGDSGVRLVGIDEIEQSARTAIAKQEFNQCPQLSRK